MDLDTALVASGIFLLRVVGNMITTMRMVFIVRGQKVISTVLATVEALVFALALGSVVTNLGEIPNLGAYCLGYALGGYLGLSLEQRLVQRFVAIRAISPRHAHEVAEAIRKAGYGATETWGRGAEGQVGEVTAVVGHQQVKTVLRVIQETDPKAFVMMEELRSISRGYIRLARHER
jgi:uncharacterized protein YebE (UPF0316 family)